MSGAAIKNHAGFIWSVADLLRGVYKQSEYGRVILPLTVLRRLDCVLEPTKAEVLETMADLPETLRNREPLLQQVAGQTFVNMLEAVVALPDQLFYNTGISTYFWVVTNRKAPHRRGKVQLIDARDSFTKMRKSLGQKRKEISAEQIADITRLCGAFEESSRVKIFPNESFGFLRITVERPLQLRWEITDDTLVAVESDKKIAKLDHPRRDALFEALRNCRSSQYATEKSVKAAVQAVASTDGTTPTALVKSVTDALAVRDPEAPVITDRAGNPKPDPDLRDNEFADLQCQERRRRHRNRQSRALPRSIPCGIGARAAPQRTGNTMHLAMGRTSRGQPTLGRRPTGSANWRDRATHRIFGLARSTRLATSNLQTSCQGGKSGYKPLTGQRSGAVGASLAALAVGE